MTELFYNVTQKPLLWKHIKVRFSWLNRKQSGVENMDLTNPNVIKYLKLFFSGMMQYLWGPYLGHRYFKWSLAFFLAAIMVDCGKNKSGFSEPQILLIL